MSAPATTRPQTHLLVWRGENHGAPLNGGAPMTLAEAMNHVLTHWAGTRIIPRADDRFAVVASGRDGISTYVGSHPMPADPHAAITDWIRCFTHEPLTRWQVELLETVMREAVDGINPAPAVLRLVAAATGPARLAETSSQLTEFWLAPDRGEPTVWRWDGTNLTPYLNRFQVHAPFPRLDPRQAASDRLWAEMTKHLPSAPLCHHDGCDVAVVGATHCTNHQEN